MCKLAVNGNSQGEAYKSKIYSLVSNVPFGMCAALLSVLCIAAALLALGYIT